MDLFHYSLTHMNNRDRFIRYVTALNNFRMRAGHCEVPASHIEILDGEEVRLGAWVGYIRQRSRKGLLQDDRIEALNQIPGWEWGPLRPGPRTNAARNKDILAERRRGASLQQIAEKYNLSRQRIHQIVQSDLAVTSKLVESFYV